MVYEKAKNRNSAIYTKASDLQQLEKELEVLREKRRSRRCSQNASTLPIVVTDSNVDKSPMVAALPKTTPLPLSPPKMNEAGKNKKEVSPPLQTLKDQEDLPSKENLSPNITAEAFQNKLEQPPAKPKRHENRPIPIVTNFERDEPKNNSQNEESHSVLLQKLQCSTEKRDNRKLNRLKSNKTDESNERDLTDELLLTALNNLTSQSTSAVSRSRHLNSDTTSKKLSAQKLKPSFSSRPAASEKVPSWKKQSSLNKLLATKGKVSTVINALENGKATTSYRINNHSKPPRPLAEYRLPSPYHQQSFHIPITRSAEVPVTTIRSPSDVNSIQQTSHQDKISTTTNNDNQTILLSTPQPKLTLPAVNVNPIPRNKQPSSRKRETRNQQAQVCNPSSYPLPMYTPQLSPLAGECDHNLTSLLPTSKSKPPVVQAERSPPILTSEKTKRLPPIPPTVHGTPSKPPRLPPHQWQSTSHPSVNNTSHRQLRVINVDSKEDNTTMNAGQTQRYQPRPSKDIFVSTGADDSSLSDNNDPGFDLNSSIMSKVNPIERRKRYSHDSGYMDVTNHPERRLKKVSFSSKVTTITTPPPATLSLHDYPENTRGFWETFSAEMGHHNYQHQATLLDKLDAIKKQRRQSTPCNMDDLPVIANSKLINKLFLNKARVDQQPKKLPFWRKGTTNDSTKNKLLDTTGISMDDRPVSQSPPLEHLTKHRPKKPASFRTKSSSVVVPEPQWRQRTPVPSSKQYPRPHPHPV